MHPQECTDIIVCTYASDNMLYIRYTYTQQFTRVHQLKSISHQQDEMQCERVWRRVVLSRLHMVVWNWISNNIPAVTDEPSGLSRQDGKRPVGWSDTDNTACWNGPGVKCDSCDVASGFLIYWQGNDRRWRGGDGG